MKKINKIGLTIGSLLAVAAPVAAVVSCGGGTPETEQFDKYVVVAANKEWVGEYQKIAKAFNDKHPDNKWKVLIKEQQDGDIQWETKSASDASIPDIWTVDNNKVVQLKSNKYITPYTDVNNIAEFENRYFDNDGNGTADNRFTNHGIVDSQNTGGKVFAVPFNKEAQLAMQIGGQATIDGDGLGPAIAGESSTAKYLDIASPQELFKVAGFGQTSSTDSLFNGIAKHDNEYTNNLDNAAVHSSLERIYNNFINPLHTIGKKLSNDNSEHYKSMYNKDFMTMIGAQEDTFLDAYQGKKEDGTNAWKTGLANKDPRLFFGTWRTNDIMKKIDAKKIDHNQVKIYAPKGYIQWLGGWAYVINKRDEGDKAKIATDFIGELLKSEHANDLAKVTGKPSPLSHITWNTGDSVKDKIYTAIDAAASIAIPRVAADGAADSATFEYWGTPNQKTEVFGSDDGSYKDLNTWTDKLGISLNATIAKLNQAG